MKKFLKILFSILTSTILTFIIWELIPYYYFLFFPLFFIWTLIFVFFVKIFKINFGLNELFLYFILFSFLFSICSGIVAIKNNVVCSKYTSWENYFCKKWYYIK